MHFEVHDLHSAVIRNSPPLAAVLDGEAQRAEEKEMKSLFVCGHIQIIKYKHLNTYVLLNIKMTDDNLISV